MSVEQAAPSFFVSGGTVPLGATSYVPRDADRTLLDALRAGRYGYVLTSRQMGKSSLSVRTMEALRAEGVRTAFVDLTRVGGRNVTAEQWYAGLLGEIGRGLGDRATLLSHWKAHPELGPMQRFFGALREATLASECPVVVFIDEIDATRSLPFSTDEFFAGIRECYNRRTQDPAMARLAFCLIGVAIPSDLMSDAKLTPFNVGERIVLRDFSAAEATALAAGLGPGGEAVMARIHHWTAGHPFLTQSLGRRAAEVGARTAADVDRLVAADLFEARARDTNVNLADVGNRVLNSYDDPEGVAKYRADVLSLYERVLRGKPVADDESNRLVAVLKLAGLVKAEGGALRVRNRIYGRVFDRAWIEEHMPNQELRRQQRAYRRGVFRATLVGTALSLAFATLGVAAVFSARRVNKALVQVQQARDDARASEARAVQASKTANEAKGRLQVVADARQKALAAANESARRATRAKADADKARNQALALARSQAETLSALQVQKQRADDQTRLARDNAAAMHRSALAARESATEADRQNRQAYLSSVVAANALVEGNQVESARALLRPFRTSKWRGWEYGHLLARMPSPLRVKPLAGRSGRINAMGLTRDGDRSVVGSEDGRLWVTDLETGRNLADFRPFGARAHVRSLALMPDETVAVAGSDGSVGRFSLRDARQMWMTTGLGFIPNAVSASADGGRLALCGPQGRVAMVDGGSGKVLARYGLGQVELSSIAISPREDLLLASDLTGNLWFSKLNGEIVDTFKFYSDPIRCVAWAPDGLSYAVAGSAGEAVYRRDKKEALYSLGASPASAVASTPDGKFWLVANLAGTFMLYDARTGEAVESAPVSGAGAFTTAGVSEDGRRLTLGDDQGRTFVVRRDDERSRAAQPILREPNYVISVAASRGGRWLAHGYQDPVPKPGTLYGHIVVTNVQGEVRRRIDGPTYASSLDLSPDGRFVAANGEGVAEVYDVETGRRLLRIGGAASGARFSRDGSKLALAEYNAAVVYDAGTLRVACRIPVDDVVRSVEFSPDGETLAIGLESGLINLCPVRGGSPRSLLGQEYGVWTLDFSPDGRRLVTGSGSTFSVYDVASGRKAVEMRMPLGSTAERAVFSADGRRIYTVSQGVQDTSARVWDAATGQELTPLRHAGFARSFALVGDDPVVGYLSGDVVRYSGFHPDDYRRLAEAERVETETRKARVAEQEARQRKTARLAAIDAAINQNDSTTALAIARREASRPDADADILRSYARALAHGRNYAEAARQWLRATGGSSQGIDDIWPSMMLDALSKDRAASAATVARLHRLFPKMGLHQRATMKILEGILFPKSPAYEARRIEEITREDPAILLEKGADTIVQRHILAVLLTRTGQLEKAERLLRESEPLPEPFSRSPDFKGFARLAMANVLAHEGRRQEAESALREADNLLPKDPEDVRISRLGNDAFFVLIRREVRLSLAKPEKRPGSTAILGTLAPSLGLAYALRRRLLQ